jgi:P4 family phage/plasmid primase-like protien
LQTDDGQIKKVPPKDSGKWANFRGTIYDEAYRRKWFADTPHVVAIAIAMYSIKISIGLDIDGVDARKIFYRWIVPRLVPSLQNKVKQTTHTISQGGGDHIILGIKREYFPLLHLKLGNATDVHTSKIWIGSNGKHNEIALMGTKSCLIERGNGYQNIRGLECEEILERDELVNLLTVLEAFQTESKVVKECVKILSPEWKQPNRDGIAFAISGWYHKDSNIPQEFTEQFFDFQIMDSPHRDENLVKTKSVIKRTYSMNKNEVIGRSQVDEIFGGTTVRSKLKRELEKLGYTFKDSEETEHRKEAKEGKRAEDEGTSFVEDLIEEFHIKTLEDTKEFYRYDSKQGIYIGNAEPFIKSTIAHRFKNLDNKVTVKMMNQFTNEIQWFSYFKREDFNPDITWIACANCMINLVTLEKAEFSPNFLCTTHVPVKYNDYDDSDIDDFYRLIEGAKYDGILKHAPDIKKFLNDLFFPEDIEKLLDYLSYCLWRDYGQNFWVLLNGGGLNGKSLLLNIISAVFENDNVAGETLQRLTDESNRFATANLYNKLINSDADISKDTVFKNTGQIKKLTGNDLVPGEQKYKTPFKFRSHAKLVFSVNKIPETYDESDAFYRRIILINLKQQFLGDKTDIHLARKLNTESELSGFFYELVRRLPRVLEHGLMKVTAETIKETQVKFTIDSNVIDYFYQKVIQRHKDRNIVVSKLDLHEEYCKFARFHKLTPESEAALSRELSKKKYEMRYARHTVNGERVYAWEGVSIRHDWIEIDDPTPEGTMEFKLKDSDETAQQ